MQSHALSAQEFADGSLPLRLAELHRSLAVGAAVEFDPPDAVDATRVADVLEGGGFTDCRQGPRHRVRARRARTLPDFVAPGLRTICVGLNPSEYAADAGVGFARPGNRFWPAALAAGLLTVDRDPWTAVREQKVGMTDLVKRATPRADALTRAEYRNGSARLERLLRWLAPRSVCFVGLTGYRSAIDRHAGVGWQPTAFAGVPTYVMPNPSGLNTHATLDDFTRHFVALQRGP